jgi:cyclophilin family peptidyl-prolyl cis-trans isomerase
MAVSGAGSDELLLSHSRPGVLSMANAGPGSNTSQFFVATRRAAWLDGAHSVFGVVEEGLPLLQAAEAEWLSDRPFKMFTVSDCGQLASRGVI